ncbi:DUF397 domain-containing protein [Streptomyces uncialis]|uniref:DUF397 domain-containing protein n=1 Tax=Streptomyces uncialis TaxID=1048205 RepID=UPI00224F0CF9|nr:DUF397 domain-containing protein [Streptomyces uncialis]MCX4663541.1 DUF397 domain-containing protein [Streptomyces uncialis]WST70733.1 DUF397 domain-containing protein [Streptomyces uncialis]WTE10593.1 DUF397 domain-containing protein [Streptomyces uncialis]
MTTEARNWTKSSYSGSGGSCVEWAPASASATGLVPVRDSKSPCGPVLDIPAYAFASFVTGVKAGEFGTV